jgi:hypothetical protein
VGGGVRRVVEVWEPQAAEPVRLYEGALHHA